MELKLVVEGLNSLHAQDGDPEDDHGWCWATRSQVREQFGEDDRWILAGNKVSRRTNGRRVFRARRVPRDEGLQLKQGDRLWLVTKCKRTTLLKPSQHSENTRNFLSDVMPAMDESFICRKTFVNNKACTKCTDLGFPSLLPAA